MFLAVTITDIVATPFGYVLDLLNRLTGNVAVSVSVFAVLIALLMHPINVSNRISSLRKAKIAPKEKAIREMFPGDMKAQDTLITQLYDEAHVNLAAGCLMSILPFFVLIMLFSAISQPLTYVLHINNEMADGVIALLKTLDPEAFKGGYEQVVASSIIANHADAVKGAFPEISDLALAGLNYNFLGINFAQTPNLNVAQWDSVDWAHIGLCLAPLFAALCSGLPGIINAVKRIVSNLSGKQSSFKDKLSFVSPVLTVIFIITCFQVPATISLYWGVKSILGLLLRFDIRRRLKKEKVPETSLEVVVAKYLAENPKTAG